MISVQLVISTCIMYYMLLLAFGMLHFSLVQKTMWGLSGPSFTERISCLYWLGTRHNKIELLQAPSEIKVKCKNASSFLLLPDVLLLLKFRFQVLKPENTEIFSCLSCLQPFEIQIISTATCQKNTHLDR